MYSRGIVCQYGSGSRQYGNGLGSIFKAAMRTVIPILKPMAKAGIQSAKHVATTHGVGALRDIMAGQNIKQVLKHRGKDALSSLGRSTLNELKIEYKFRSKSFKSSFICNPSFGSKGSWS